MFQLVFETVDAAFDGAPATEVVRILREVAVRIEEDGELDGTVRDLNGNTVGHYVLKHKDV